MLLHWVLSCLLVSTWAAQCPEQSTANAAGTACYTVSPIHSDWISSEGVCQLMGGHLTSVADQQENDVINKLVLAEENPKLDSNYFFGGRVSNKQWSWTDGTPFGFSPFVANYPLQENFVTTLISYKTDSNEGKWDMQPGDNQFVIFPFVCKTPTCSDQKINAGNVTGRFLVQHGDSWYFGHSSNRFIPSYSQTYCSAIGGSLPIVKNAFDNSAVQQSGFDILQSRAYSISIGLSNPNATETGWVWADGTPVSYTNWANGEPYFLDSPVRLSLSTGLWFTTNRPQDPMRFVCQLPTARTVC